MATQSCRASPCSDRLAPPFKMFSFKLSVLLASTLLLSPSLASSFAPLSSISNQHKNFSAKHPLYTIRGGDEESAQPEPVAPPSDEESAPVAPSSPEVAAPVPPAPVEPASVPQVVAAVSFLGPNAVAPGLLRKAMPSFPWHKLPNWLTYIRCIAIPLLVAMFYMPGKHVETSILFAVASFTDWLDGYLARRWDIASPFGAFLDPVADKLMVSTALILLSGRYGMHVVIPTAIILAREISVSALREWMAQRQLRDIVKVGFQGKLKTALTMLSLTLFLLVPTDGAGALGRIEIPAKALLYLCAGITVTSGSVYFRAAAPVLLDSK